MPPARPLLDFDGLSGLDVEDRADAECQGDVRVQDQAKLVLVARGPDQKPTINQYVSKRTFLDMAMRT